MPDFLKRLFGMLPWRKEWQESLSVALGEAQRGLNLTMVVIIARESDLYAELLFLLSFLGLAFGAIAAYLLAPGTTEARDLILYPLAGFAAGSTIFSMRRFFISRLLPVVVRERVNLKAKSHFFDNSRQIQGEMGLLYLSELEREAVFLASPDTLQDIPSREIQDVLSHLIGAYKMKSPLDALRPSLLELGDILRRHHGRRGPVTRSPVMVTATDRPAGQPHVIVLKGTKDIN